MDTQATIIGFIILLIVITPLILIQASQKKKKKQSKKEFFEDAEKHHLDLKDVDFWGTYYAMATDEVANKLLYSKIINGVHNTAVIDLNTVNSCSIKKTERRLKNKTTNKSETDKIDLVISYKTSKKPASILEFYNIDVNFEMSNESDMVKKWEAIINSKLLKSVKAA
ncbi:hypothetical protein [Hwangdonia lutea]|uniref:Uncharacterized protein n=1 Tax=Hwangdonia lutea TaxID=3075823 RepID=A0AA97HRG6_9FLAO|nr:hypothetical protein [Hwangdonia sp. SCSIO 19198]WOD44025.1 hypothetical protein RNZ46_01900 [Hwangdonia sp. SCSIO 19198]